MVCLQIQIIALDSFLAAGVKKVTDTLDWDYTENEPVSKWTPSDKRAHGGGRDIVSVSPLVECLVKKWLTVRVTNSFVLTLPRRFCEVCVTMWNTSDGLEEPRAISIQSINIPVSFFMMIFKSVMKEPVFAPFYFFYHGVRRECKDN